MTDREYDEEVSATLEEVSKAVDKAIEERLLRHATGKQRKISHVGFPKANAEDVPLRVWKM